MTLETAIARVRETAAALAPEKKSDAAVGFPDILAPMRAAHARLAEVRTSYERDLTAFSEMATQAINADLDVPANIPIIRNLRDRMAAMLPAFEEHKDRWHDAAAGYDQAIETARAELEKVDDAVRDFISSVEGAEMTDITDFESDLKTDIEWVDELIADAEQPASAPDGDAT